MKKLGAKLEIIKKISALDGSPNNSALVLICCYFCYGGLKTFTFGYANFEQPKISYCDRQQDVANLFYLLGRTIFTHFICTGNSKFNLVFVCICNYVLLQNHSTLFFSTLERQSSSQGQFKNSPTANDFPSLP